MAFFTRHVYLYGRQANGMYCSHTISNIWKVFKKQQAVIWTTEEIDLRATRLVSVHWIRKRSISCCDHIFLCLVGLLILDNLMEQFMGEVTVAECKTFMLSVFIETIHSETYATMLHKFVLKTQINI